MIHNCRFYKGKISDITVRGYYTKTIHCRRCGAKLQDSEINSQMLNKIRNKQ